MITNSKFLEPKHFDVKNILTRPICLLLPLFILIALPYSLFAQGIPKRLTAKFITEEITLDGILDEAVWQTTELGINSHLQWRFAQLSDLYLVYNDNYFTETFSPRFKSINLKLTYWLNL